MSVEAILRDVRELKVKVDRLYQANKPKQTWVSASWITGLTGWDRNQMRRAREQNIIEFRTKDTGSFEYLLQSLDEKFIVKKYNND